MATKPNSFGRYDSLEEAKAEFERVSKVSSRSFGRYDSLDEAKAAFQRAKKAVPDGESVLKSVYPDVQPTSNYRPPDHPLSRKNPDSWHTNSSGAIDTPRVPGMTFEQYVQGYKDKGYDILEAKDEYANPSPYATGGHWHVVLGGGPQGEEVAQAAPAAPAPAPAQKPINQDVNIKPFFGEAEEGSVDQNTEFVLTDEREAALRDMQDRFHSIRRGASAVDVVASIKKDYGRLFPNISYEDLENAGKYYLGGGKDPVDFFSGMTNKEENQLETANSGMVPTQSISAPPPLSPVEVGVKAAKEISSLAGEGVNAALARGLMTKFLPENRVNAELEKIKNDRGAAARFWEDQARRTNNPIIDELAKVVGATVGDVNPSYLLSPGTTAPGRILSQAAVGGLTDLGVQAADVSQDLRPGIDPSQVAINAVAGAGFQGVMEGLAKLATKLKTPVKADEDGTPYVEVKTSEGIQKVYDPASPLSTKAQLLSGTSKPAVQLPKRIDLPEGSFKDPVAIADQVEVLTANWKDAPEFKIHQTFDELPEDVRAAIERDTEGDVTSVKAWVDEEGRVNAIADHLEDASEIPAFTYHEALGHVGLRKLLGDDIDNVLRSAYETNPALEAEVNAWFKEGGSIPDSAPDITARATEEVLAERSESGPLDASTWDKLKNIIKKYARKTGLEWDYSDREIRTILAMAHNQVINGGNVFVGGSGNTYMYVGRSANNFNAKEFTSARDQIDSGMAPQQVREETGWFKAPDGKWRKEISDDGAASNLNGIQPRRPLKMRDVLFHTPLYKAYPEIADIWVSRDSIDARGEPIGSLGYFDAANNKINIRPGNPQPHETLLHEIQHWVQEKEGFAKGGDTDGVLFKMSESKLEEVAARAEEYFRKTRDGLEAKILAMYTSAEDPLFTKARNALDQWREANEVGEPQDVTWPLLTRQHDIVSDIMEKYTGTRSHAEAKKNNKRDYDQLMTLVTTHLYDDIDKAIDLATLELNRIDQNWVTLANTKGRPNQRRVVLSTIENLPYQAYEHLFGEVEARDTANRAGMTMKERLASVPYTSDPWIEPDDYIFDFQGQGGLSESNKYMRKKGPKAPDEPVEPTKPVATDDSKFVGNIRLDRFEDVDNIKGVLQVAAKKANLPRGPVTHEQTKELADALNMTPRQVKEFTSNLTSAEVVGMARVLKREAEAAADLVDKIYNGQNDELTKLAFARKMALVVALEEKVMDVTAEAGRALNAYKILIENQDAGTSNLRYMAKQIGNDTLGDLGNIDEIVRMIKEHGDNPEVARKLMRDAFKPLPEDYLLSFRYNMMLYGLGTHLKNVLGTVSNMGMDFTTHALATGIGKTRSLITGSADRITSREMAARTAGIYKAMTDWKTLTEAGKSFNQGRPTHQVSKVEIGHNIFTEKFGKAGIGIDLPTKALAAEDSIFRSIIESMARNGLAIRSATRDGLKGQDLDNRVSMLLSSTVSDPKFHDFTNSKYSNRISKAIEATANKTPEEVLAAVRNAVPGSYLNGKMDPMKDYILVHRMDRMANMEAAVLQLVDEPTWFGKSLERLKTRPTDRKNYLARLGRGLAHIAFPFSRVTDRLFMTGFRHIPILGMLDEVNRTDWAAGGARRDLVMARMVVGASLIAAIGALAEDGRLSDAGPGNYDSLAWERTKGWQPKAIRVGDEWIPLDGLDSVTPLVSMVTAFTSKVKRGELGQDGIINGAFEVVGTAADAVKDNTFMKQAADLFAMFQPGSLGENAKENYAAGLASSFIPASVRQAVNVNDDFDRDMTGDGSYEGKITGRIKGSLPGLREELPVRHDVFGRPVENVRNALGIAQGRKIDDSPVTVEIDRLTEVNRKLNNTKGALITPVDRGDLAKSLKIPSKNIPSSIVQEYQKAKGEMVRATLEEYVSTDEWKQMSDEDKIKLVRKISTAMGKYAREDLFGTTEEDSE